HRFAECSSGRRALRAPQPRREQDAGSQDAVSSLEGWLRWRPDPLRYHLANDSRRLLPGGFGEGEQLLIKEGDRRGTKSFGVNNAQRSVLSSELAPEAMMALSGGNIQRHRTVPEAVAAISSASSRLRLKARRRLPTGMSVRSMTSQGKSPRRQSHSRKPQYSGADLRDSHATRRTSSARTAFQNASSFA